MAIFKRKYIDLILQGKKTQTRRISRYRLKIGKAYAVRSKMLEPAQARIIITRAWRQQLQDLTPEDIRKEGSTASPSSAKHGKKYTENSMRTKSSRPTSSAYSHKNRNTAQEEIDLPD